MAGREFSRATRRGGLRPPTSWRGSVCAIEALWVRRMSAIRAWSCKCRVISAASSAPNPTPTWLDLYRRLRPGEAVPTKLREAYEHARLAKPVKNPGGPAVPPSGGSSGVGLTQLSRGSSFQSALWPAPAIPRCSSTTLAAAAGKPSSRPARSTGSTAFTQGLIPRPFSVAMSDHFFGNGVTVEVGSSMRRATAFTTFTTWPCLITSSSATASPTPR
jgi:hypothetical protein